MFKHDHSKRQRMYRLRFFLNVVVIFCVLSETSLADHFEWKKNTLIFRPSMGNGNSCLELLSRSEQTDAYYVRPKENTFRDFEIEAEKVARLILDINANLAEVGLPIPKSITVWLINGDIFGGAFNEHLPQAHYGRGISAPKLPIAQAHEYAHLVFDLAFRSALIKDGQILNNFLISLAPQEVIRLARRRIELLQIPKSAQRQTDEEKTDEEIDAEMAKEEKMWDEEIWDKYEKLETVTFIRQFEELFTDTLAWAQLRDLDEYDKYIETIKTEVEKEKRKKEADTELLLLRVQLFDVSETEKKALKPLIKSAEEGLHEYRHNFYDDVRFWIGQRHRFSSTQQKYKFLVDLLRAISSSVDEAYRDQGPHTKDWTAGARDAANFKLIQKLMALESNQ